VIVIDASAAADLLLGTERAGGVARALSSVSEAHAPELLDPEVVTVVQRWTRRGWLAPDAGGRVVEELGELAVVRHRHAVLLRRTWELRDRCSAYDACYVALAEVLGAQLLTTDDRLGRSVAGLVEVASVGDH